MKSPPIRRGGGQSGHQPDAPGATSKRNRLHSDRTQSSPHRNGEPNPPCRASVPVPHNEISGTSQVTAVHVPAQRVVTTGSMIDNRPTRTELLAEVYRLVYDVALAARTEHGPLPGVGSPEWWTAPPLTRIAAIMVLGEAFLCRDAERLERLDLKEVAVDISAAHDWKRASQRPSYQELVRRRAVIT
jgi:hypothetical protein